MTDISKPDPNDELREIAAALVAETPAAPDLTQQLAAQPSTAISTDVVNLEAERRRPRLVRVGMGVAAAAVIFGGLFIAAPWRASEQPDPGVVVASEPPDPASTAEPTAPTSELVPVAPTAAYEPDRTLSDHYSVLLIDPDSRFGYVAQTAGEGGYQVVPACDAAPQEQLLGVDIAASENDRPALFDVGVVVPGGITSIVFADRRFTRAPGDTTDRLIIEFRCNGSDERWVRVVDLDEQGRASSVGDPVPLVVPDGQNFRIVDLRFDRAVQFEGWQFGEPSTTWELDLATGEFAPAAADPFQRAFATTDDGKYSYSARRADERGDYCDSGLGGEIPQLSDSSGDPRPAIRDPKRSFGSVSDIRVAGDTILWRSGCLPGFWPIVGAIAADGMLVDVHSVNSIGSETPAGNSDAVEWALSPGGDALVVLGWTFADKEDAWQLRFLRHEFADDPGFVVTADPTPQIDLQTPVVTFDDGEQWFRGETTSKDAACGGQTLYRTTADGPVRVFPSGLELDTVIDVAIEQDTVVLLTECQGSTRSLWVRTARFTDRTNRFEPVAAPDVVSLIGIDDGTVQVELVVDNQLVEQSFGLLAESDDHLASLEYATAKPGAGLAVPDSETRMIPVFSEPGGTPRTLMYRNDIDAMTTPYPLVNPTVFRQPLVLRVLDRSDDGEWLEVQAPVRPHRTSIWVRADDFDLSQSQLRVEIDLNTSLDADPIWGAGRLRFWDQNRLVLESPIVSGRDSRPTTLHDTYVEQVVPGASLSPAYGTWLASLASYSDALGTFGGGGGVPGQTLHGTNAPELVGQLVSSGGIRVPNDVINDLIEYPGGLVGARVTIFDSTDPRNLWKQRSRMWSEALTTDFDLSAPVPVPSYS